MKSESFLPGSHASNQGRKWEFPHTEKLAHIKRYAQDHQGDKRIRDDGASLTSALRSRRRARRGFLDVGSGSSTSIAGGPAADEAG